MKNLHSPYSVYNINVVCFCKNSDLYMNLQIN